MVFLGGAVLADIMKDKQDFWMTKAEYDEMGLQCLAKLGAAPKWIEMKWAEGAVFVRLCQS